MNRGPVDGTEGDPPGRRNWTYSLGSLMLLVTLAAVTLGIAGLSPGLAVAFGVLLAPALIRTAVAAHRARLAGDRLNGYEKAWVLVGSMGVMLCTCLAAAAAFWASCWVGFTGAGLIGGTLGTRGLDEMDAAIGVGLVGGLAGGLTVLVLMIRWVWPIRERPR